MYKGPKSTFMRSSDFLLFDLYSKARKHKLKATDQAKLELSMKGAEGEGEGEGESESETREDVRAPAEATRAGGPLLRFLAAALRAISTFLRRLLASSLRRGTSRAKPQAQARARAKARARRGGPDDPPRWRRKPATRSRRSS